jgi:hypothetical protein
MEVVRGDTQGNVAVGSRTIEDGSRSMA